ncbi:hypothetical protein [Rhizobium leguminosarum]|uniref:hypothetical protein n=1 Tax=Rhizobium leguminosarum TaxID=384 RepID=UPI001FF04033|nr:hypothetical protein [Rhizobium leguminosarum]
MEYRRFNRFKTATIPHLTHALHAWYFPFPWGLFDVPGLDFCGTPGMTVARIKREYLLARELRSYFDTHPAPGAPLATVARVRDFVKANADLASLLDPEPFPRLAAEEPPRLDFGFILSLAFRGLLRFFWQVLCLLGLLVVAATIAAGPSQGFAVGVITFFMSAVIAALGVVAAVVSVYVGLGRLEATNTPIDTLVNPNVMASLTDAENLKDTQQNHLAGITIMQAGHLRGLTLRIPSRPSSSSRRARNSSLRERRRPLDAAYLVMAAR